MTIVELIDQQVIEHIAVHGCVKHMDPFALHLLKTSEHPLMRWRRWWMRATALKQVLRATKRQQTLNKALSETKHYRKSPIRQNASLDPWMQESTARHHKASWNDPDFLGYVKREEPAIFPKRESI